MPQVPPWRADVRHRLDAVVLRPQRPAELDAQIAGLAVTFQKLVSIHGVSSPLDIVSADGGWLYPAGLLCPIGVSSMLLRRGALPCLDSKPRPPQASTR